MKGTASTEHENFLGRLRGSGWTSRTFCISLYNSGTNSEKTGNSSSTLQHGADCAVGMGIRKSISARVGMLINTSDHGLTDVGQRCEILQFLGPCIKTHPVLIAETKTHRVQVREVLQTAKALKPHPIQNPNTKPRQRMNSGS